MTEFEKCKNDVVYFVNNYCRTVDCYGVKQIKLYPAQVKTLKAFAEEDKNLVFHDRQVGMTLLYSCYALWEALFHENRIIGIDLGNTSAMQEVLTMIILMHDLMDEKIRKISKINSANKMIKFSNGSMIRKSNVRDFGSKYTHMIFDNLKEYCSSDISYWALSKSKVIILGSQGIKNTSFLRLWYSSYASDLFNKITVGWDTVPGRDDEWEKKQMEIYGAREFVLENCAGAL